MNAIYRWPEVITQSLRPREVSLEKDVRSMCKLDKNELSLVRKLSTIKHSFNLRKSYSFGCPAYVLTAKSQDQNSTPRLDDHIRVGTYLGPSKNYAVSLKFKFQTYHISPQFHVVFDNNFGIACSSHKGAEPARFK